MILRLFKRLQYLYYAMLGLTYQAAHAESLVGTAGKTVAKELKEIVKWVKICCFAVLCIFIILSAVRILIASQNDEENLPKKIKHFFIGVAVIGIALAIAEIFERKINVW